MVGGMTVRSNSVTVTSSQTRLSAEDNRGNATTPSYTLIQNTDSSASIFVGGDNVTNLNGVEIAAGEREWFVLVQESLWAVTVTGTVNVRVLETQR